MSAGYHYSRLGRYAEARAAYEAGLTLAESVGDRFLQTNLRFDLCYVLWCNGDPDGARALGERALQELRISAYRPLAVATCLAYLGVILEGMAEYHTAAAYLAESRALFVRGGQHGVGMEAQAIEAYCQLALGQRKEAQQLASEVWAFLDAHGTVTMDYPSRVYLCIADVVAQVASPEITEREVLDAGYAELLQKAEMIDDPAWRRSFLEDELSNRALAARWKSLNLAAPDRDRLGETTSE
jgi:tetratricopeptide (TPR) repeat protein